MFRTRDDGRTEILCVHRPKYGDWSLPKGKQDPGETDTQTALREVAEETGVNSRIVGHLAEIEYSLASGQPKLVHFFAMKPVSSVPFVPNSEVDEIRWVTVEKAAKLLTYPDDRWLVANADYERFSASGTVFLVRHAAAGDRSKWKGDDAERPITEKGAAQAAAIADILGEVGIDRIVSSPYLRCRQTVEPLAERLSVELETSKHLAEGAPGKRGLEWIQSLSGLNTVLCSHGDMIPEYLNRLARRGMELRSPHGYFDCKKASIWTVHFHDGTPAEAIYQPPPVV